MAEAGVGEVPIRPDFGGFGAALARGVDGPLRDTESKFSKFGGRAAASFGAAFAGVGVVAFFSDSIGAASELNGTISRSNTVFGENAVAMESWASGAAKNLGQSKNEALAAAATFGNMFTQLDIGTGQAADMSKGIVELASDFAAFNDVPVAEVVAAQQAAFRGEYDSLQRFLPLINAATVEQKALQMTGKKTTKELTAQDKALATNALMFEGAGAAMGANAREADSLAGKQARMNAQWKDAQAKIGQALIPAMTALVGVLTTAVIPAFMKVFDVGQGLFGFIQDNWVPLAIALAVVLVPLAPLFALWALNAAAAAVATLAAAAPVIGLGLVVAALAIGIKELWENCETFRTIVLAVWDAVQIAVGVAVAYVQVQIDLWVMAFKLAWEVVQQAWTLIEPIITGIVDVVAGMVSMVKNIFTGNWSAAYDDFKGVVSAAFGVVVDWFIGLPLKLLGALAGLGGDLMDLASKALGRGKGFLGGFIDMAYEVMTWVKDLPKRIVQWIGDLSRLLFEVGKMIIQGLWDGMKDKATGMFGWVDDMGSSLKTAFTKPWNINSPSKVTQQLGSDIIEGYELGFRENAPTLIGTVSAITGQIESLLDQSMARIREKLIEARTSSSLLPGMDVVLPPSHDGVRRVSGDPSSLRSTSNGLAASLLAEPGSQGRGNVYLDGRQVGIVQGASGWTTARAMGI